MKELSGKDCNPERKERQVDAVTEMMEGQIERAGIIQRELFARLTPVLRQSAPQCEQDKPVPPDDVPLVSAWRAQVDRLKSINGDYEGMLARLEV